MDILRFAETSWTQRDLKNREKNIKDVLRRLLPNVDAGKLHQFYVQCESLFCHNNPTQTLEDAIRISISTTFTRFGVMTTYEDMDQAVAQIMSSSVHDDVLSSIEDMKLAGYEVFAFSSVKVDCAQKQLIPVA